MKDIVSIRCISHAGDASRGTVINKDVDITRYSYFAITYQNGGWFLHGYLNAEEEPCEEWRDTNIGEAENLSEVARFAVLVGRLGYNIRSFENNLLPGQKDDGTFYRDLIKILALIKKEKELAPTQAQQAEPAQSASEIDFQTYKINFGKYKKTKPTIAEIATSDPNYYEWMKETITSQPLASIIEAYEKSKEKIAEMEDCER